MPLSRLILFLGCALFAGGCASSPNERAVSERLADVAVAASTSALTGLSLGAHGGAEYSSKLEAVLLGGSSCLTLLPQSLTLGITDIQTGKSVAEALPILKDWIVVADLKLFKGDHQFVLTQQSSRILLKERHIYSGEGAWKPVLHLSCPSH